MLRKLTLFFMVSMLVSANVYAAPDRTGKFDAGVAVAADLPDDDETGDAVFIQGSLAYGINENWAIGLDGGWAESESEEKDNLATIGFTDIGDLTVVPLFADIILRLPIQEQPLVPYGILGLGVIFRDFEENSRIKALGTSIDVDSSFGLKLVGGLDWFINNNWIVNFEVGYIFSDADSTTRLATGASTTVESNADALFIGAGVKYVFD